MTSICCLEAYESFIENKDVEKFRIVDGPKIIEQSENSDLLILDSSFNPPHWAHFTLVKKAVDHYRMNYPSKRIHVLLLLSVQNADKEAKPASFDKRTEMMCLMAKVLETLLENIKVSVGLTIFGKFVDKDRVVRQDFFPSGKTIYLVGFDTIIRIFNKKYYLPDTPAVALGKFMENTEFCCLTRNGDDDDDGEYDIQQSVYAQNISDGLYEPLLPRSWGKKVIVLSNDNKYASVSSSSIRSVFSSSKNIEDIQALEAELPKEIIDYIVDKSVEQSIFM